MSLTERRLGEQLTGSTQSAGSGSAAHIKLGRIRDKVEIYYDVGATSDDIVIEVSEDDSTWRELDRVASGSVTTGGSWAGGSANTYDTTYTYARAYAGSSFADGDVNAIEISGKA